MRATVLFCDRKSEAVLVSTSHRDGQVLGSHDGCPVWPQVPQAVSVSSNGRRIDPEQLLRGDGDRGGRLAEAHRMDGLEVVGLTAHRQEQRRAGERRAEENRGQSS